MRPHWIWMIVLTTAASAATVSRSPDPELSRAEELYRRTDYAGAIGAVEAMGHKDAARFALLGKAYFMEGRYKVAVATLEKAIEHDPLNSDYSDWLGKAYGRMAERSSALSAFGYARKTVRAFERAVELDPSNLEALSDLFEYYLEAPGIVGGGLDRAESIAGRMAGVNDAEHHWARARLAERRKDFSTAETEFRAAQRAAPADVGRSLDLAAFLSSRGRYAESDALFRAAMERHPNAPKVLYAPAAAYVRSRRKLEEAEALLEKYLASQITPDDPTRQEARELLVSARNLHLRSRDMR